MIRSKKSYIAEILLEHKLITEEQLNLALEQQKKTDKKIGQILVELGFIKEDKLLELLSHQLNIPYIDLKHFTIDPPTVKLLPEFYARHYRAIILKKEDNKLLVGMVDPTNLLAREEIESVLNKKINLALIREEDFLPILDNIYRHAEEITQFAGELSAELQTNDLDVWTATEELTSKDIPVVNLLRSIFEDAAQMNASDIHIEPGENILRIRLRIDGLLQEQVLNEKDITHALVQRIKLMSGLNIAEKRLPQDGRFSIHVRKRNYDIRVSTLPQQHGESVVMRLLNQSAELLQIEQLGMPAELYQYYAQALLAAYGILLIVGPTGSGKTTTLYASLNRLNSPEDKIITVEDPVEYRIERINQVQVNPQIDLTFANVLRSILRQDPDIIMIGEIRDKETLEIALRAAMTGHLVLATLHTNDSISTITRLLDMGAEGYLLAGVLRAILAQRLVRRICSKCIQNATLTPAEQAWVTSIDPKYANQSFKHGAGCTYCRQTGYLGRQGVFEILPISSSLTTALRENNTSAFYNLAVKETLYHPLTHVGLEMATHGITTVDEIIRMAGAI
ncbi:MAG: MSHA biogenesis protein MshE [Gammaproteobacteria bacterium RIFCSPHIGHO2_12_FULL_37_34]|nr:MAG: MSHA biogenesis protein MshE [Gammaproteobacteria bacterium RIFCSPHIGHO2_12_FULL_37_34]